jgi:hypothetical protein
MVNPTDKVSCPKGVVDGERPLKLLLRFFHRKSIPDLYLTSKYI